MEHKRSPVERIEAIENRLADYEANLVAILGVVRRVKERRLEILQDQIEAEGENENAIYCSMNRDLEMLEVRQDVLRQNNLSCQRELKQSIDETE